MANSTVCSGRQDAALYGSHGWPPLRVQMNRNGFIHAMLTGTPLENHGYEYFGERAYERWIQGN